MNLTSHSWPDDKPKFKFLLSRKECDPDWPYKRWIGVGMALHWHSRGLEEAKEMWREWSHKATRSFDDDSDSVIDDQWKRFKLDHPDPTTIGTLVEWVRPSTGTNLPWAVRSSVPEDEPPSAEWKTWKWLREPVAYSKDRARLDTSTPDLLVKMAMKGTMDFFESDPANPHKPGPEQLEGLRQIAKTIQTMAMRLHENPELDFHKNFYLSSLACGMGKTTVLIECIKALEAIPALEHVSIIVFLTRLEDIRALMERISFDSYACFTNEKDRKAIELNSLGLGKANCFNARVLFTTQRMLAERLAEYGNFSDIKEFHYKGKSRLVRVWDEAIIPSKNITLAEYPAHSLVPVFGRVSTELAEEWKAFLNTTFEHNQIIPFPDLKGPDGRILAFQNTKSFCEGSEQLQSLEAACELSGQMVKVDKEKQQTATFRFEDVLPDDLAPLLILDAGGLQRETYRLWKRYRNNLKELYSPIKAFNGYQIFHWDTGAAKSSQKKRLRKWETEHKYKQLARGFAKAIDQHPDEKCLVGVFLPHKGQANMQEAIDGLLVHKTMSDGSPRVEYCTWGQHTARNDFRDIKHMFLVGVLQLPGAAYKAEGLGAKGARLEDDLSRDEYDAVRLGDFAQGLMQFAGRTDIRNCVGNNCPPGNTLHIAFSTAEGTGGIPREMLERIFPGATIEDWVGEFKLTGNEQSVCNALYRRLGTKRATLMSKPDLSRATGIRDLTQLNKLVKSKTVIDYLRMEMDIEIEMMLDPKRVPGKRGRPAELIKLSRIAFQRIPIAPSQEVEVERDGIPVFQGYPKGFLDTLTAPGNSWNE